RDVLRPLGPGADYLSCTCTGVGHHAVDDLGHRIQPEVDRGDHAEVAAAALECPEQIRILGVVGSHQLTVGGHEVGSQQAVGGEAEGSHGDTEPAAEGVPHDAHAVCGTRQTDQTVRIGGLQNRAPPLPGAQPGELGAGVDLEVGHPGDVDDDAAVARMYRTVPGGLHSQGQASACGDADGSLDVGGGLSHHHEGRLLVDGQVPRAAQ